MTSVPTALLAAPGMGLGGQCGRAALPAAARPAPTGRVTRPVCKGLSEEAAPHAAVHWLCLWEEASLGPT